MAPVAGPPSWLALRRVGDPIEGRARHWRVRVVPGRQKISGVAGASLERDHDVQRLSAQVDVVRLRPLHALLWDGPDGVVEIDLVPNCILQLALPNHGEEVELHTEADRWQRRNMHEPREHDADLCAKARGPWRKGGDRGWTDVIGRIGDLLAVQNGKAVDLLQDITHMDMVAGAPRSTILPQ